MRGSCRNFEAVRSRYVKVTDHIVAIVILLAGGRPIAQLFGLFFFVLANDGIPVGKSVPLALTFTEGLTLPDFPCSEHSNIILIFSIFLNSLQQLLQYQYKVKAYSVECLLKFGEDFSL